MILTQDELLGEASAAGFQADVFEKVVRLLELLGGLRSHAFLRPRLALKGGTAIHLFLLDVPRLSVDVDLDYVGAVTREETLAQRPRVEQATAAVCRRLDLDVRRVPTDHAGGKWRLAYTRADGGTGALELDLNFLLRTPLWPPVARSSKTFAGVGAQGVQVLDVHELVAGKLAALFGRSASRDVFDARTLLARDDLDRERLRLAFVVYGGVNRRDWRTVARDEVLVEPREVERNLLPLMRRGTAPARSDLQGWTEDLVRETRDRLDLVLPLRENEREFLERLNDLGVISPELLTEDPRLRGVLAVHPGLLWKAENVRRHGER